jgi:signal transduction histidine kinase
MTPLLGTTIPPTPSGVLVYGLVLAAIVLLVALFSLFGDVTSERTAERTRMIAHLEQTIRENEELQNQLVEGAREAGARDERERIALDIHDTLAQDFTGIVTQLQAAERSADRGDDLDLRHRIELAIALARDGLEEARRSVRAIGPPHARIGSPAGCDPHPCGAVA